MLKYEVFYSIRYTYIAYHRHGALHHMDRAAYVVNYSTSLNLARTLGKVKYKRYGNEC